MDAFVQALASDHDTLLDVARNITTPDKEKDSSLYRAAKQFLCENTPQQMWTRTVPFIRAYLRDVFHLLDDLLDIICAYQRVESESNESFRVPDTQISTILQHTQSIQHGDWIYITHDRHLVVYTVSGNIIISPLLKIPRYTMTYGTFKDFSRRYVDSFTIPIQFHMKTEAAHPVIRFLQDDMSSPPTIGDTVLIHSYPQPAGNFTFDSISGGDPVRKFSVSDYCAKESKVWIMSTEHDSHHFPTATTLMEFELRHLPINHPAIRFLIDSHWEVERSKINGEACAKVGIHTHHSTSQNRVFRAFVFFLSSA